MSLYRTKPWLAVCGLIILMGAPALAQTETDMQYFDPKMPGGFGGGPAPNEGYFFGYEQLYWTLSRPPVTPIGNSTISREVFFSPTKAVIETNTIDTSYLTSDWVWGQRYQFGDILEHHGWMVSYYNLRLQSQIKDFSGAIVTIDDQPFSTSGGTRHHLDGFMAEQTGVPGVLNIVNGPSNGAFPLPLQFDFLHVENFVKTWSVEADYLYRTHPFGFNQSLLAELSMGVRYMQFDDEFNVFGSGTRTRDLGGAVLPEPNSVLADSEWRTQANNHIIGPQFAARMFTRRGRWEFSTEGKFFAGFNMQDIRQNGLLGSRLNEPLLAAAPFVFANQTTNVPPWVPAFIEPTNFNRSFKSNEFSPGIEFSADAKIHLTRGFNLRAGYTFLWIDNIARASNMIDYAWGDTAPLGILASQNRQSVFMNGLSFGAEFNR